MRCTNPGSKYCDCFACMQDKEAIDRARNRVAYSKIKNSLVSWTLSDEWTTPPNTMPNRGMSETNGMHTAHMDGQVVGEIPWRKFDILLGKWV